ncbi:MAG: hypothetical protein ACTSU5_05330 [Promethearchaeota archaeon]
MGSTIHVLVYLFSSAAYFFIIFLIDFSNQLDKKVPELGTSSGEFEFVYLKNFRNYQPSIYPEGDLFFINNLVWKKMESKGAKPRGFFQVKVELDGDELFELFLTNSPFPDIYTIIFSTERIHSRSIKKIRSLFEETIKQAKPRDPASFQEFFRQFQGRLDLDLRFCIAEDFILEKSFPESEGEKINDELLEKMVFESPEVAKEFIDFSDEGEDEGDALLFEDASSPDGAGEGGGK